MGAWVLAKVIREGLVPQGQERACIAEYLANTERVTLAMLRDAGYWTCSHDTGHIWEEILPHPSELMSRTLKDLERQTFAVFWGMIRLSH
jgi:hypothetical protein